MDELVAELSALDTDQLRTALKEHGIDAEGTREELVSRTAAALLKRRCPCNAAPGGPSPGASKPSRF